MENRCKFWLPKKNRFCANAPVKDSVFCGNHNQRSNGERIPCPIDPSHYVLQENLGSHLKRCPFIKQVGSLSVQPFYQKAINAGEEEENEEETEKLTPERVKSVPPDDVTSEMKRTAVHGMSVPQFYQLIRKIKSIHSAICRDIKDSYQLTEACRMWIERGVDRKLPFQEKHVLQQVSILGNLEAFGVLRSSLDTENRGNDGISAAVEFGAGRGYLTQMLADCYAIKKVFLVERRSYKLKADRSLRQNDNLELERLRIDIEDLNLNGVESLHGLPYVAIGKHLCGPTTDLTLRCCLGEHCAGECVLEGLAIATCCHHLCQWKHYINKQFFRDLGISREEFHAMTRFTSWAVDNDHSSSLPDLRSRHLQSIDREEHTGRLSSVEDIVRNMEASERAVLGFMCKQIIDAGRLRWVQGHGLRTKLVKYVPSRVSPENILLVASRSRHLQAIE